ncbi:MAG: hypothetical protein GX572_02015 [Clostridia bacterium]|nr:hypothetical protein [Clostridia bacterium]
MYKLSKREKLLLYICLLLAIAIGGLYALILPAAERNMALKEELLARQMTVSEAKAAANLYPGLQSELERLEEKALEAGEDFYAYSANERLEAMMTTLLLKHNLTPISLLMSDTIAAPVAPYQPPAAISGSGEAAADGPLIYSNSIQIMASGSEARILAFLAELETLTYARAVSLAISVDATVPPAAPVAVNFDDPVQPALAGRELYAILSAEIAVYLY